MILGNFGVDDELIMMACVGRDLIIQLYYYYLYRRVPVLAVKVRSDRMFATTRVCIYPAPYSYVVCKWPSEVLHFAAVCTVIRPRAS